MRQDDCDYIADGTFDIVVVGGGINGASILHALTTAGYRTLLVDKGDIAGGTSQASAMLVWGGLLYASILVISFRINRGTPPT